MRGNLGGGIKPGRSYGKNAYSIYRDHILIWLLEKRTCCLSSMRGENLTGVVEWPAAPPGPNIGITQLHSPQ